MKKHFFRKTHEKDRWCYCCVQWIVVKKGASSKTQSGSGIYASTPQVFSPAVHLPPFVGLPDGIIVTEDHRRNGGCRVVWFELDANSTGFHSLRCYQSSRSNHTSCRLLIRSPIQRFEPPQFCLGRFIFNIALSCSTPTQRCIHHERIWGCIRH